ncbi:MAG: ribose-phosphate pyrophosphokinase [Candidatus Edwardsbacteria bacterium]|nr:ribose-phosphate pyrophosphokinase [Candidatus Edwardsbacteria bacterium]MBU1576324.1 ribose-phosphate pyrophosphokinase [Candidatus Edwardsbacteria bacterium]MBU2462877.1 ribose-phosphate pyrophosphokinase [Candidatus Edwardsbacteria bacterium]MBU2593936.1 ribose-phosphate pyrophosphokinase [Candidatus Edwardsbacteria bacterium]
MNGELKVFSGTANPDLSIDIGRELGQALGECTIGRFSDGEIRVQINENVRGTDVFILQPTFMPSDNLMELLILMDAARRASAKRITAVIPYFGYARQERKDMPRVPISAKLVANLITVAGAHRILTMDLHTEAIQGFFDIPVDHLYASPVLIKHFQQLGVQDFVVVSPDTGGVNRARAFAKRLGDLPLAFIDKRRPGPNKIEVLNIIGEVADKNCLIVDDVMDTARTICEVAGILKQNGAKSIYATATHGVLSGQAIESIAEAPLTEVVLTNTIPLPPEKRIPKIKVLSISKLLADAIKRIHNEESVSSLFN